MDQFKTISLPPLSQTTSRLPSECLSFFAFPDPALRNDAIMQLKASLQHTVKQWPFLCGTVVPIYGTPLGTDAELPKQHNMITLRYLPSLPDDIQEAGLLEVMEVSKEQFPYSYADLCQAGVPQSYLQDDIFKPMVVDGTPETHIPVYRARIIFVDGGLIIANFVHHAVFSGYERAQIVQRWAENCRRLGKGEVMCDLEKNGTLSRLISYMTNTRYSQLELRFEMLTLLL